MELRHVKIFVLAAEYQNFSKVAEFAFISQSSVSKYIQILEDELGGALFVRDGRHTELSEFGRAFLPHAISILEKEEEAKAVLQHFKQGYRHETCGLGLRIPFWSLHPKCSLSVWPARSALFIQQSRAYNLTFNITAAASWK